MKKKLLSILLVVCVILCAAPITTVPAAAASITFSVIDGTNAPKSTENWDKLMDSDTGTKWCLNLDEASGGVYVIFKASESSCVTGYKLTTGNDTAKLPGRNPKNWVLYGCNNYDEANKKGNWEAIHTVTNDSTMPSASNTAQSFSFSNTTNYQYYKFVFTKTQGEKMLQLSEISFTASLDIYDIYINNQKISNSKRTLDKYDAKSGILSGEVKYYPNSKTLVLTNLIIQNITGPYNAIIYSNVPGLRISFNGNCTFNVLSSDNSFATIYAKADCTIDGTYFAQDSNPSPQTIISAEGRNVIGIRAEQSLNITDNYMQMIGKSSSQYTFIQAYDNLTIGNSILNGVGLTTGIGTYNANTNFTAQSTQFNFTGNNLNCFSLVGNSNLRQCTGSLVGYVGIYSYGYTALSDCNMSFKSSGAALTADNAENLGALLGLYSSTITIYNSYSGIQAVNGGTVVAQRGLYKIDVNSNNPAVKIESGSKMLFHDGTLNLKLTSGNTASPEAFSVKGDLNINGGQVTTSADFSYAICNDGTGTVKFYGGTHTLSAKSCGYLSNNKNNLIIENNANVTFEAELAITHDYKENAPGAFTMTGGTVNLNYTYAGLCSTLGAGVAKITGGTLNFNGTKGDKDLLGIYKGKFEIGGTADVNFTGNEVDIYNTVAGNKITGGNLTFTASERCLNTDASFEISGGNIEMTSSTANSMNIAVCGGEFTMSGGTVDLTNTGANGVNIFVLNDLTCRLTGGKLTTNSTKYISLVSQSSTIDFAGTDATIRGNYGWGMSGTGKFTVSGGKVVFIGQSQATLSGMYSSISGDYGVFAGSDENHTSRVTNVTNGTFTGNKYVCIKNVNIQYTLTLENVQGGATSASYKEGNTFSYTAAAASEGQHFDHWELTVNGTTSNVGTNSTYNGTMPGSDATLKAVYAKHTVVYEYVNESTHRSHCSVCNKDLGTGYHSGGTGTATEPPTCTSCNHTYAAIKQKAGSAATINYQTCVISNVLPGATALTDFIDVANGYRAEYTDIGTGKTVKIYNNGNALIQTYTLLTYGDVNGDGWYDGEDAVYVNMIMNNMLTESSLGSVKWQAADCNKDGNINDADYQIMVNAGLLLNEIDQNSTNLSSQAAYADYLELTGLEIPAENVDSPIIEETDEATTDFSFSTIIAFVANAFKMFFGWIFKNIPMPIK